MKTRKLEWFAGVTMAVLGFGADARGAERIINHEVVVSASIEDVWNAWTTVEGLKRFGPADASIDFRVGGKYEWYFSMDAPVGQRGAEGCTILSYVPHKALSFTWNAPPKIAKLREAGARTPVTVTFDELGVRSVRVRLAQIVSGESEDWDQYHAYFTRAWASVLGSLKESFADKSAVASTDGLVPLDRFVGEWTTTGTWENPTKGSIRVVYEWGLNRKVLKGKSYVVSDAGEQLVYETFMTWHPQRKSIVFQSVSAGGALYDGTAAFIDRDTLEFTWNDFQEDKTNVWRQTLRFVDDGAYAWTVFQRQGDQWEKAKESTLKRVSAKG